MRIRLQANAQELIGLLPNVIVANSAPAVMALARQTKTTPIVFANFFNPVGSGLIASLARPGGNVTGFSNFEPAMAGKWLELLREIAPDVTRVAAMFDRTNVLNAEYAEFALTAEKLAPSFHLQYTAAPVSNAVDVQEAICLSTREPNSGLIVMGGTVTSANRETIVQLAAQHRVPAVYAFRYYITTGGLLSYGVDGVDLFRRTGYIRRPHSKGCETSRVAGASANQVRAGDQSEDRQSARPHRAADTARHGRRGD